MNYFNASYVFTLLIKKVGTITLFIVDFDLDNL